MTVSSFLPVFGFFASLWAILFFEGRGKKYLVFFVKKISESGPNGLTLAFPCGKIISVAWAYASSQAGLKELGSIAQLGEHLPYKQRVTGSSPVVPTKKTDYTFV